ncbi:DM13 domain-containing protein [Sphingomonas paucimobilis]|jgi:hypothetical protein|uniref:DM13 domain-containing protein n=1 Tax=Sphingomonas paucimobilis TaxID=13689 RepID=UPI00203ADA0D|nr:DM13 domain-containing protein [Sphingomonas paucimobilis]MCM3681055.1 DM13 domain-containing protein [Sphingomonas paucimobilis]
MRRWLILATTHVAMLALGFAAGIYALPILTAPPAPDAADLASAVRQALYTGQFKRSLKGSDFVHWGEGNVKVSRDQIAHIGRLSPGPDYKLYLAPHFVRTKDEFLAIKHMSRRVGEVKTFDGFIISVAPDIDVAAFTTVVIWCESFDRFISAAEYQRPATGS